METTPGLEPDQQQPVVRIETTSVTDSPHIAKRARRARLVPGQRLGLGDLLLWLTFVSVYFAIVRMKQAERDVGPIGLMLLSVQATVAGFGWSGLGVLAYRVFRGLPLPQAPGHWLLSILGIRLALEVSLGFKPGEVFDSPHAVVTAVTCCALVLPTLQRKLPTLWKSVFGVLVTVFTLPLLGVCGSVWFGFAAENLLPLTSLATWLRLTISPSLPLVASLYLAYCGERYHGLHWIGIATWIAWHLLQPALLDHFV